MNVYKNQISSFKFLFLQLYKKFTTSTGLVIFLLISSSHDIKLMLFLILNLNLQLEKIWNALKMRYC